MTFVSFYNWFILFDFGIGHGLKNILSEEISLNKNNTIKNYAAAGILSTIFISVIFILIFESLPDNLFNSLFLTNVNSEVVKISLRITFYSCIILFLHNTLSAMMHAAQKSSNTNHLNLIVNSFLLVTLILLVNYPNLYHSNFSHLKLLSFINLSFYVIGFFLITFFFLYKNKYFIPSLNGLSIFHFRNVLTKGGFFFIIQISVLVLFPIDSFLIGKYVSASAVGEYNVIIKLFGLFIVAASTINQSSWPAITEAYYKKDFLWMKKLFKRFLLINTVFIIFIILMSFYTNNIVNIWMNKEFNFSPAIISLVCLIHIFYIISISLSTILYSTNFLKSQIVIGVLLVVLKSVLLYISLNIFGNQLSSVLITTLACFAVFTIFNLTFFVRKFRAL